MNGARLRATGVVLVTHGRAGEVMLEEAERVVGHIDSVATVTVSAGETAQAMEARLEAAVRLVGGRGVVLLVDLAGSTPSNLARRAAAASAAARCAIVSGMNLPMLFKLATVDRSLGPEALADELASTGQKSIQVGQFGRADASPRIGEGAHVRGPEPVRGTLPRATRVRGG